MVVDSARAAEEAIRDLCRATLARPRMKPAEVDVALMHLGAAAATLAQTAGQVSDILERAKDDDVLGMDTLTETQNPDLAVDSARRHLDAAREPALSLSRLLDAAHQQTAHIAAVRRVGEHTQGDRRGSATTDRRPEQRPPPTMSRDQSSPGPTR